MSTLLPPINKSILVICDINNGWFYSEELQQWKLSAQDDQGNTYPDDVQFINLPLKYNKSAKDIYINFGNDKECTLETFLLEKFLWMPLEEYDPVLNFLNLDSIINEK